MASSGTIKSSNATGFTNCPRHIVLEWSTVPDPATNTDKFSYKISAENYGSEWVKAGPIKVTVTGKTLLDITDRIQLDAGEVLASGSFDIEHNSDGSKTISVSISAAIYSTSTNSKYSGTITLDKINRISTLSVDDGTLGTEQTLKITQYSTSFTHTIKYSCGSATGTIVEKSSDTSVSFTPPLSLASQAPSGTKVTITFEIETFNGSTSLGSNKYTNTYSIPDSVVPTLSFTAVDANGYFETYGKYIQNKSEITIEITAEGAYGSTIKSYKTTLDGKTYTDASFVPSALSKSGTLSLVVSVTDSRGRTVTLSENIEVLAYTAPRISSMKVERCTSDGALSTAGGYLKVTFNASVSSLDSKNTAVYTLQHKESTETEYAEISLSEFENDYYVSNGTYIFEADKSILHDVKIIVTDIFGKAEKSGVGPTSVKIISILKKLCGFAIGKIAEIANAFEVALTSYFYKSVTFYDQVKTEKGSYVHYTVGESGVAGYINIAQIVCKGDYANTPIILHVLQRDAMKNTYSIRFMNDSSSDPSISAFTYEGNRPAYLVKTDTSTWDLYIQKTEKYDAVCVTQLENSYYVNSKFDITWKDTQVTDLPDGYKKSTNSTKYRLSQILGTTYTLETSVVAGSNWTISDQSAYLVGNTLRLYFKGTRSSSLASGNVTNETVVTFTITHNGKINGIYNVTSVNGLTGGVVTFNTTDTSISDDTLSVSVMLTAASTAVTEVNTQIALPVTLNMDAYF